MRVLHVDSSARRNRSHTRRLSALFVDALRQHDPNITLLERDLAAAPPPFITEDWIAAAFTAPHLRTPEMRSTLRRSDYLVDELISTDLWVFGVPMYNYSVPALFKTYIDQIVRVGRTFSFDPDRKEQPYTGLIEGKTLVLITARGDYGYGPNGPHWAKNHVEPYVAEVFGFLGVNQIHTVAVENDEFGGVSLAESIRAAEVELRRLASEIAENATAACAAC